MSNKEINLKENLRQALSSTIRVISDDLKIDNNTKENKSSNKFDFFELDNFNSKIDFIKARAEADSTALKKKFSNNEIYMKNLPNNSSCKSLYAITEKIRYEALGSNMLKGIEKNLTDNYKQMINLKRKDQLKTKEDVPIVEAFELYMLKNFYNIKLNSLSSKMLNFWEKDFNQSISKHINFLKKNFEDQSIYSSKFSKILQDMDIFQSEDNDETKENNQDEGKDNPSNDDQENHLEDKNLFGPTLYDYGFIANNLAVISSYIFGFLSIGGFYIIKLILVFLVKLSLIFISRSLVSSLELENNYKINFFVLFTFIIISLPDYYNPLIFYQRYLLYLLFILYLGLTLTNQKNKFQLLTLGFFSLFSVLWWWDIGAYTNALIFLTLVYLLIHREFKNFLLLLIGISISWGIFFLISGTETLENFFYQFNFIYSASDYLLGIEYPIPFSEDSIRGTKTLIIFYLISVMLIHLNLSKKYKVSFKTKILLNTLFLAGIIGFKTALMRSDTPHIKYASGIIFFLILFLILFFIFQRLKASNNILSVYKKYNINFILFILLSRSSIS